MCRSNAARRGSRDSVRSHGPVVPVENSPLLPASRLSVLDRCPKVIVHRPVSPSRGESVSVERADIEGATRSGPPRDPPALVVFRHRASSSASRMARVRRPTVVEGLPNGLPSCSRRCNCVSARCSACSTRVTRSSQSGVFAPPASYSGRSASSAACMAWRLSGRSWSRSWRINQSSKHGLERATRTPLFRQNRPPRQTEDVRRGRTPPRPDLPLRTSPSCGDCADRVQDLGIAQRLSWRWCREPRRRDGSLSRRARLSRHDESRRNTPARYSCLHRTG